MRFIIFARVIGPLLFLVYINDIIDGIKSNIPLFADDTSVYIIVEDPDNTVRILNKDFKLF